MDEITLFAELRPPSPGDAEEIRARARARLATAIADTGTPAASGPLTGAGPAVRRPRHRRRIALGAAAAAAAACAAIVVPTVVPAGASGSFITDAWAVQPNQDGTITVTVKQLSDPAALQRDLRADGVPAVVYAPPAQSGNRVVVCGWPESLAEPLKVSRAAAHPAGTRPPSRWIISPGAIPHGTVLFIGDYAWTGFPGGRGVGMVLLKKSGNGARYCSPSEITQTITRTRH